MMKLRLSLLLFFACTLLAGRAMAQDLVDTDTTGCTTTPFKFPPDNGTSIEVPQGHCIASVNSNGTQTGRLRWNPNHSNKLELFDTDDGGRFLWCAGGDTNSSNCTTGAILCAQGDGNLVIYSGTDCSKKNQGRPNWATNTNNGNTDPSIPCGFLFGDCNEDGEELFVQDNLIINGGSFGESAVIYNDTDAHSDEGRQLIWHSKSSDPS